MSEFKGTKGKWHIDENHEIKHNVFSICLINRFTPTTDIFKANALLISKAPILLEEHFKDIEFLEKVVRQLGNLGGHLDIDVLERIEHKKQLIKEATEI